MAKPGLIIMTMGGNDMFDAASDMVDGVPPADVLAGVQTYVDNMEMALISRFAWASPKR